MVAALTTWWSGPVNAHFGSAFRPGQFDTQGIVPVGYGMFAMALGIAAGTVARRSVPAIAVTLGGFVTLRLVISGYLRPHYLAAGAGSSAISRPAATGRSRASRPGSTSCWPRR